MDDAQGAVAVILGVDDHPESIDVRQLREADGLTLQFAPDRIGVFLPTKDARGNTRVLELGGDFLACQGDGLALAGPQRIQPPDDGVAGDRIEVAERQLLQLAADFVAADRAGQRRVDLQRLARDPFALGGALDEVQRAHVVQAVSQLDQQHPHILGDGQDELAQIFGLTLVLGRGFQARELGHALDQLANLFAEQAIDVGPCGLGVLDDVVQKGRDDGRGVQPVVGQDARHLDGVGEIGIAGGPGLRAVHTHGVDVGAVQQRFVGAGIVGAHPIDQLVLTQELAALGLGLKLLGSRLDGKGGGLGRRLFGKRFCALGAQ